ncbi:hypothetical protein PAXRUDRAFT_745171 [Paxillus rubicundulus Ve08.2h10]|uniref:Uncharacterized protein n=1 Tax=Paxillus rubicundulus Ve08.2h10 TaxID=930991 RepID=A0A0D0D122_9AGAM|nr:hypothetical protein PAXRUDRAFT_745171 [Paxillus rubicundulus Ve08.2h10]
MPGHQAVSSLILSVLVNFRDLSQPQKSAEQSHISANYLFDMTATVKELPHGAPFCNRWVCATKSILDQICAIPVPVMVLRKSRCKPCTPRP